MSVPLLQATPPTIEEWDIALRLGVASVLSAAIGLQRARSDHQRARSDHGAGPRDHGAGMRTHMLVGLGAALFTLVSTYGFSGFLDGGTENSAGADPTQIAAQIVMGAAVLGAGVIFRQGASARGLTTAAALWVAGAIGLCAGAAFYTAAVLATAIALIGLGPMLKVEDRLIEWVPRRRRPPRSGRRLP